MMLRRAAAAAMLGARRHRSAVIDLLTAGTFTRSGAKMVADGSPGALVEVASGTRAVEDRGDGLGDLLVFEDSYRQWALRSKIEDTSPWAKTSWAFGTPAIAAPDGAVEALPQNTTITSTACRLMQTLTGSGAAIPDSARACVSVYARDAAADIFRFRTLNKAGTQVDTPNQTPSASGWQRHYVGVGVGVGSTNVQAGLLNGGATLQRFWDAFWGFQFDVGDHFPHRLARSTTAVVDVPADDLTLDSAEGAMLFTGPWRIAKVSLDGADTDRDASSVADLWSVDANNRVSLEHDGAFWRVRAYQGGALKASSVPIAWNAYGSIGAVDVRPADGVIAIEGVDGPAGPAWAWTSATSRFGGRVGGGNGLRGRIDPVIRRPS